MEIEKFTAKKNESQTKKEQEKSSVFNSYPSTGNPFEKSPTFSKSKKKIANA